MIGEVELELCHRVSGESPHQEFLATKGEGVQHIALAVEDLAKEIARLSEAGATVVLRASLGAGGAGLAYVDLNAAGLVSRAGPASRGPERQSLGCARKPACRGGLKCANSGTE